MSERGKLLKGHALHFSGYPKYDDEGNGVFFKRSDRDLHAGCQCGALAPAGQSLSANKRWHRAHKVAMSRDLLVTVLIWTVVVMISLVCWWMFLRSVAELLYR